MSRIQPIATSRITDSITRNRLTSQIQSDELAIFRLQNQLSTGRRIILPSEDPAAAQRASVLQRTLERQTQSVANLRGARVSLANTESAVNRVAAGLNELKSSALSALDSFSLPEERDNLIIQIDRLLEEFARVGNSNFSNNFLLGGADRSSGVYQESGAGFYDYLGDESTSRTFIDIGLLFDQGVSGDEVLGGLSESIRGFADLNPPVTPDTPLSRLNGGAGVTPGGAVTLSYAPSDISQPGQTVTIDLSAATTLDDVARLIEASAPQQAGVAVSVDGSGLRISAADGGIAVGEIAGGSTAAELGVFSTSPTPNLVGEDLNPTLDIGARLDSLLGTRARARIVAPGTDNDLTLTANTNGPGFAGLEVRYQDVAPGSESATFAPGVPPTLTVGIVEGQTTAQDIAALINAEGTFIASTDRRDQSEIAARGLGTIGTVTPTDNLAVDVSDGSGQTLDLAAGLIITNGDEPFPPIDTSGLETVEDLLTVLNDPVYGLQASINEAGDGLDVRSRRSGADFSIGENGGQLATQLGIRTFTGDSRLADFNRGQGVLVPGQGDSPEARAEDTLRQNEFVITILEDGVEREFTIDPTGLTTVNDLIERINAPESEGGAGGAVEARLTATGNGIELVATDNDVAAAPASGSFALGADTLTIEAVSNGPAGNRPFTVEVVDSAGAGPVTASVTGDAIVIDLDGLTATTDEIAALIEAQLPGFTVAAADGTETISAASPPTNATTGGGAVDSALATQGTGGFGLNGDTISIASDQAGPDGNLPSLAINLINSGGSGPLSAELVGDTVTVDLAGLASSTDAIAAAIQTALNDASSGSDPPQTYTVASDGTAAVATTDADPPPTIAAVTGGALAIDTTASGDFDLNGDTISIVSDQTGPDGNLPALTIALVDSGGAGPLSAELVGDTLTVDLAGLASSTDAIAAAIQTALNDAGPPQSYTVTSDGNAAVATTDAGGPAAAAAVTGGAEAVDTIATGSFDLNGDTVTIRSIRVGPDGNLPDLAIEFVDSGGAGPLSAELVGDTLTVDLAGLNSSTDAIASAIQAVLNDSVSEITPPQSFSVTSNGNAVVATTDVGVPSVDAAVTGGRAIDSITVEGAFAQRLGFFGPGEDSVTIEDTGDPANPDGVLVSSDVNTREVDSVFTTLIRLRDALQANDEATFRTEVERLDVDLDRVTFGRAEIGVRLQTLDSVEQRLADEEVTLREALSNELDADLAEVISEFTARQFALQASLQTAGQLLNLTILDFL